MVADLVPPAAYIRHRNQVACVSDQRLAYLRRKVFGGYYTIEYYSLAQCTRVEYRKTMALGSMIGGILLVLLGITYLVFGLFGNMESVHVWLVLGLIVSGATLAWGVKRHSLRFHCGEKMLKWISSPGDFKARRPMLENLREFLHQRGIVGEQFPGGLKGQDIPSHSLDQSQWSAFVFSLWIICCCV